MRLTIHLSGNVFLCFRNRQNIFLASKEDKPNKKETYLKISSEMIDLDLANNKNETRLKIKRFNKPIDDDKFLKNLNILHLRDKQYFIMSNDENELRMLMKYKIWR